MPVNNIKISTVEESENTTPSAPVSVDSIPGLSAALSQKADISAVQVLTSQVVKTPTLFLNANGTIALSDDSDTIDRVLGLFTNQTCYAYGHAD